MNVHDSGGTVEREIRLDGLLKEVTYTTNDDVPTVYAFRYTNLGLTAYGHSEQEAEENMSKMLRAFLSKLFLKGLMNERLNKASIKWHWTDTDFIPPEPRWITQESPVISVSTAVLAPV